MDRERIDKIKKIKEDQKAKSKEKKFTTMSTSEKWEIVEAMAKILGLIK